MTQIGLLDITKSKTFPAFLAYLERLGHIGRSLTYDEASLLNKTITKILRLNHTSLTTVITTYRASTTITLDEIVTAARLEYHSAISGGRWTLNDLLQPLRGALKKDKDKSNQVLALRAEFDTFKKTISQTNTTQSNTQTDRNTQPASALRTNLTQNRDRSTPCQREPFKYDYGPGKDLADKDAFFN